MVEHAVNLKKGVRSCVFSGGGSKIAYAQGFLYSPGFCEQLRTCDVVGGVSAGAMFATCLSCCWDNLHIVRKMKLNMLPHWGNLAGVVVDSLLHRYVFSHEKTKQYLLAHLPTCNRVLQKDLTVGLCDISNTSYKELLFRAGTHIQQRQPGGGSVLDYVVASGAIYGIFQAWSDNTCKYIDGGYAHNVPRDTILRSSADSLIMSICPLDIRNPLGGTHSGFWKFITSSNAQFYYYLYMDTGQSRGHLIKHTKNGMEYETDHGYLIGPTYQPKLDITLSYCKNTLCDLRTKGTTFAKEVFDMGDTFHASVGSVGSVGSMGSTASVGYTDTCAVM